MDSAFSGAGPGPQTRDGCSVELYRRLPYRGEIDCVQHLLRPGSSLLELGCGTGRITRILLGLGLQVTCVDDSIEMLSQLPSNVVKVHADIESVRVGERFDAVVPASCLINHPSRAIRAAFVQTSVAGTAQAVGSRRAR